MAYNLLPVALLSTRSSSQLGAASKSETTCTWYTTTLCGSPLDRVLCYTALGSGHTALWCYVKGRAIYALGKQLIYDIPATGIRSYCFVHNVLWCCFKDSHLLRRASYYLLSSVLDFTAWRMGQATTCDASLDKIQILHLCTHRILVLPQGQLSSSGAKQLLSGSFGRYLISLLRTRSISVLPQGLSRLVYGASNSSM